MLLFLTSTEIWLYHCDGWQDLQIWLQVGLLQHMDFRQFEIWKMSQKKHTPAVFEVVFSKMSPHQKYHHYKKRTLQKVSLKSFALNGIVVYPVPPYLPFLFRVVRQYPCNPTVAIRISNRLLSISTITSCFDPRV